LARFVRRVVQPRRLSISAPRPARAIEPEIPYGGWNPTGHQYCTHSISGAGPPHTQIQDDWGVQHVQLATRPDLGQVLLRMKAASLNYRDLLVPTRDLQ
jgi:hypothetical protein